MKDLIKLQNAHVTQITGKKGKGDWEVQENITNELLYELPHTMSESDIFTVLDFARKYELQALNAGIRFQNHKFDNERDNLLRVIEEQQQTNDKLARSLHRLMEE